MTLKKSKVVIIRNYWFNNFLFDNKKEQCYTIQKDAMMHNEFGNGAFQDYLKGVFL